MYKGSCLRRTKKVKEEAAVAEKMTEEALEAFNINNIMGNSIASEVRPKKVLSMTNLNLQATIVTTM